DASRVLSGATAVFRSVLTVRTVWAVLSGPCSPPASVTKEGHEVRSGWRQDRLPPEAFPAITRSIGLDRDSSGEPARGRLPCALHWISCARPHQVIDNRGRVARGG